MRVVRSEDGGGESAWGEGAGDSGAGGKDGGPLQPQPGTTATTTCPPTGLTANTAPTPQQTLLTLTTLMTARTHMHIRHRPPTHRPLDNFIESLEMSCWLMLVGQRVTTHSVNRLGNALCDSVGLAPTLFQSCLHARLRPPSSVYSNIHQAKCSVFASLSA